MANLDGGNGEVPACPQRHQGISRPDFMKCKQYAEFKNTIQGMPSKDMWDVPLLTLFLYGTLTQVDSDLNTYGLAHIYPAAANDSRVPLTLGLLLAFTGDYVTLGAIPGIQLAIDIVNNGTLLSGYRLQYSLSDSQCDPVETLTQFFGDIIQSSPIKVGFIGSGCDDSTITTAEISYFFNLTQSSLDCTSAAAEDRFRLKRYFQILPNDIHLTQAIVEILDTFQWRKLHAIELEFDLFVLTVDSLISSGQIDNVTHVSYSGSTESTKSLDSIIQSGQVFNTESRILYLAMYLDDTLTVLCEAYRQNKIQPLYVLITFGWYNDGWWNSTDVNCTNYEMEKALNRSLAITLDQEVLDKNLTTSSGLSFSQYIQMYTDSASRQNLPNVYDAEPGFDAVWAYALVLNKTIQDLRDDTVFNRKAAAAAKLPPNATFFMENFTYSNSVILERMYKHMSNISFVGITGNVTFNPQGIRIPDNVKIQQYRFNSSGQLSKFDIAYVSLNAGGLSDGFHFLDGESADTTWPSGIPHDGTTNKSTITIELWITVVMYILSTCGLVLSIGCSIFVVVFRKNKFIHLTSPNLTYIMCGGCGILYISIFFLAVQSTDVITTTVICNIRVWLWAMGYSIAFGPVLGKMYRIYYIFNNLKPNQKKTVTDWMLVTAVCVLAGLDVLFLLVVTALPQLRTTAVLKQSVESPSVQTGPFLDVTMNCIFVCESKIGYTIWYGILLGYKGIIQIVAILLAFGTRKVKVKGINDSKYIAAIIYVTSICLVMIMVSFATLGDRVNTLAAIFSFGFWCAATTILLLVFLPKIYAMYKDPNGTNIFPTTVYCTNVEHTSDTVANLERQIRQLKQQLASRLPVMEDPTGGSINASKLNATEVHTSPTIDEC